MPLPRGGIQLDYSRWMQNMLALAIPEVLYDVRIADKSPPGDQFINATVVMNIRLGVKNIGDAQWKEYYRKKNLKRTITCRIDKDSVCGVGGLRFGIQILGFCDTGTRTGN